jgi:parvulin-like peptidyl-prolyl isomerase
MGLFMKKLLLLAATLYSFSQATMVDAIALIVEGEAVTTAEINAVQRQMGISKKEATDLLIQDRLQKVAMNDIAIDENDVDMKIANIAAQNNLTVSKMQQILKEQGSSWSSYRSTIKDAMKKEKFYQEKVVASLPTPNEEELKLFYANHKNVFVIPATVTMMEYSAASETSIKNFLATKNTQGIHTQKVTKETKDLNSGLLSSILQTQDGSFTRPLNAGDRYITYKILSKNGTSAMPFEAAQGAVEAQWRQQQQTKALKDYFEKMKTSADIQRLR